MHGKLNFINHWTGHPKSDHDHIEISYFTKFGVVSVIIRF